MGVGTEEAKMQADTAEPQAGRGGFPGGSAVKNLPANAGDPGSVPGLERALGRGHAYPLQYSCQENPMARGAWWATVHGAAENQT